MVGVIDLDNGQRKEMKSKHTSVCLHLSTSVKMLLILGSVSSRSPEMSPSFPIEHQNVRDCLAPLRSELFNLITVRSVVSGGYDSSLLHFDYRQGNILSRYSLGKSDPRYPRPHRANYRHVQNLSSPPIPVAPTFPSLPHSSPPYRYHLMG